MKAVLLCAGRGERLRPFTDTKPKHMIRIGGRPVLYYVIQDLVKCGFSEFGIVVGEMGNQIIDYFRNGNEFDINISYIFQKKPLGTAHALLCAEHYISGDSFLLYLADTLNPSGLQRLVTAKSFLEHSAIALTTRVSKSVIPTAGVVDVKKRNIVRISEKKKSGSNIALAGAYIFDSDVFDIIPKLSLSERGEYDLADLLQNLIDNGKSVINISSRKRYIDTGSYAGLLKANRYILEKLATTSFSGKDKINQKIIGKDTNIAKDAKLIGPVYVGNNCTIETGAVVGPFVSIDDNIVIKKNTLIQDSIVMSSCIIEAKNISGSIIGDSAVLSMTKDKKGTEIFVRDNSVIVHNTKSV